ncbi:hypothetical protein [Saccharothrix xinjiangensis]|uniref:MerR-like DNA binding protein n=1 Tax=Saccharothrix xinjiangensis TaxID=204798 RepID=A0ABV9YB43_9PSEU
MGKDGTALRPVDPARAAGISTRRVRNHLDAGVLPPAERSEFGYRRFEERHRQVLLTSGVQHRRMRGRGRPWAQVCPPGGRANADLLEIGYSITREARFSPADPQTSSIVHRRKIHRS